MKKFIITLLVIASVATGLYFYFTKENTEEESKYDFTQVEYGNIENYVSSTGTLETVGSVEVGTQLSGKIEHIYVDYNEEVKENQILALLDTLQLHLEVQSAQADVEQKRAQLSLSKFQYENDKKLYQQSFISELALNSSESDYLSKKALLSSSLIKLEKAKINLYNYAYIRSPINGQIIDKAVEEGQTVSASMSAPTLFVIAEDISQMEIYASIDETDIGNIQEGQKASFTVETYPEDEFEAVVSEIRLQPETISNVVNYTVVLQVESTEDKLLPGMTATIEILINEKSDVLKVDNSALSVSLDQQSMMEIMQRKRAEREASADSTKVTRKGQGMGRMGGQQKREMPQDMKLVYYLKDGQLDFMPVKIGATDGYQTEISGRDISEGMELISKVNTSSSTSSKKSTSNSSRRMGPPGLF